MNNRMRQYIAKDLKSLRRIASKKDVNSVTERNDALSDLTDVLEENGFNLDSYPEALQNTERVQTQMNSQDTMIDCLDSIKEWFADLDNGNNDEDDEDNLFDLLDEFEEESYN